MKFNDIEKDYITVLRGRVRPFFAPLTRNGMFDSGLIKTDRGHRIIEVPIWLKYNDLAHFRKLTEEISEWLVHEEPKTLEFADEPDRIYYAIVDDTMNEDFLYNIGTESVIKFICGYKYSQEKTINISDSLTQTIEGHTSTLWKSKTTFTEKAESYELKFNNPSKSDLRDINKIKLNYNFIAGDILEVDYSKRKATLNGNDITSSLIILQSNFMELPIGNVEFTVSHKTDLFYNERYY